MFIQTPYLSDIPYAVDSAARRITDALETSTTVALTISGDPDFGMAATRAFEFLRAQGDRRYSNNSLMELVNLADRHRNGGFESRPPAFILTVSQPYSFDEETEVKKGGVLGVVVQTNDGTCRAMLATAGGVRRRGVAGALLGAHLSLLGGPTFWLHPSNAPAQHFLLRNGFQPVQMNRRGAVRYAHPDYTPDGGEE